MGMRRTAAEHREFLTRQVEEDFFRPAWISGFGMRSQMLERSVGSCDSQQSGIRFSSEDVVNQGRRIC